MKTSLATVTLSGDLLEKLEACAAAGFHGVEIFENDFLLSDRKAGEVRQIAADLGLEIIALQPFRDFEALPDEMMANNFKRARRKFELMRELGTNKLLICSNVSPHTIDSTDKAAEDLHKLAQMAAEYGMQIGFEALAWGKHTYTYEQAWDIVSKADHPHLGIILDSFHIYARHSTLDLMKQIPADKITLVQLADAPDLKMMDVLQFSRHFRCFPGQGDFAVVEFMQVLKQLGYNDYVSHEIFNDEFRASSARAKAVDGMRSLIWLEDQTRAQAPHIEVKNTSSSHAPAATDLDIAFVEFAIEEKSGQPLVTLLDQLGFTETHRHKSKNVSLYRQGGINLVINKEIESIAHTHFLLHGVSVCALGLGTPNPQQMLDRARHYLCPEFRHQTRPGELNIPAIKGVGDSLIYFVDNSKGAEDESTAVKPAFYDVDFNEIAGASTGAGLKRIDHISQTVTPSDFLSASFFYKSVFNFNCDLNQDLNDLYGLVVSKTLTNADKSIRIPLNMSASIETSAQRFMRQSKGSGFQQIACECDDIFAAARRVDQRYVLQIPANYYEDLDAKYSLPAEQLAQMQALNILYDRDAKGEFFHFYTKEVHGVFFEILQRNGYERYGEANAHVRMACQTKEYKERQERINALLQNN
ncbi:TIM barrel protein [Pokkaliibacter sp. MBI-7]|uniref:bifunctional sugar phosphate isomerase/epimerase/4-hydroxyphenylpyruvate dioxygenase family protein n=1 Tax=Pokkaliibacter sp. MBI-7 TaxID=3040600 RepID=UPI00244A7039|nr:sugar phosphate isomerase/epimerase and 4-hydroxyphenylpyruvate domain-containing protein [Pokkaliibacter sp. MBI-7]MDH2431493.1 TIM barrel protein [Pokkaliibacter sp. MBI-7]